jgi:integrase
MQKCWGNVRALQNLRIKNGIFIFRRKIPLSLQALIKRREIIKSLGRCDARQARLQAARLWVATERIFEMLTENRTRNAEDADLVGPDEIRLFIDKMMKDSRYCDEYFSIQPGVDKGTPIERWLLQLEYSARQSRADLVKNEIHTVVEDMQELAQELNIPVRRGSQSEKLIGRAMLRAEADFFDELGRRERKERGLPAGEFSDQSLEELKKRLLTMILAEQGMVPSPGVAGFTADTPSTQLRQTIVPVEKETNFRRAKFQKKEPEVHDLDPGTPVTQLWQHFLNDRIKAGLKDTRKLTSSLNLWTALHGDSPANKWTDEKAIELGKIYVTLPNDYSEEAKWPGKDLRAISKAFQEQILATDDASAKKQLMASGNKDKTWNRHVSAFNSFWVWAKRNNLVSAKIQNPFAGLRLDLDEDEEVHLGGSEKRQMWEDKPLRKLLASPLFTGAKSSFWRWRPGEYVKQDTLYWVVLIAAHTGMRREEICQLRGEHLICDEESKIWYFNLKAPGLVLKNKPAKRWVPLPNNLLELGIIKSLYKGPKHSQDLLFDLYASAADDKFGDKVGQKFGTYRQHCDEFELSKHSTEEFIPLFVHLRDLHSFRHTVATLLIRAGVPKEHAQEVTGHKSIARAKAFRKEEESNRSSFDDYNHGGTLQILKAALEKLNLPIDIPRLKKAAGLA